MTLNDWKKTAKGTKHFGFKKNKKEIYVTYTGVNWIVEISNLKSKYFKTKYSALKFARAYMRKH